MNARASAPVPDERERARVEELARQVAVLARRELGPQTRVWWFGSWPEGRARSRSDLDIAVLPDETAGPEGMARFRQAVEDLPTLYRIDLVDLREVGEAFRQRILKRGRVL